MTHHIPTHLPRTSGSPALSILCEITVSWLREKTLPLTASSLSPADTVWSVYAGTNSTSPGMSQVESMIDALGNADLTVAGLSL